MAKTRRRSFALHLGSYSPKEAARLAACRAEYFVATYRTSEREEAVAALATLLLECAADARFGEAAAGCGDSED